MSSLIKAIDSILSQMNHDSAGRLRHNIPFQTKAGNPVVYEVEPAQSGMMGEPDYFTIHGYEITNTGKKIVPRSALALGGSYWVGRSDLVWSDYSTSAGDGPPRFVVMANRHRDLKYEEFHIDSLSLVYSAVITISTKGNVELYPEC